MKYLGKYLAREPGNIPAGSLLDKWSERGMKEKE